MIAFLATFNPATQPSAPARQAASPSEILDRAAMAYASITSLRGTFASEWRIEASSAPPFFAREGALAFATPNALAMLVTRAKGAGFIYPRRWAPNRDSEKRGPLFDVALEGLGLPLLTQGAFLSDFGEEFRRSIWRMESQPVENGDPVVNVVRWDPYLSRLTSYELTFARLSGLLISATIRMRPFIIRERLEVTRVTMATNAVRPSSPRLVSSALAPVGTGWQEVRGKYGGFAGYVPIGVIMSFDSRTGEAEPILVEP